VKPAHACLPLFCLALAACQSPREYEIQADRDVYALVRERRAELFQEGGEFRIDPPQDSLRARILAGQVSTVEGLDLRTCLEIAAQNNRDYQARKESLYRAALDVTFERWDLGWISDAGADIGIEGLGDEGTAVTGGADYGLRKVLGTGAEIVGGIGLSLFKDILGGGSWGLASSASLAFTQPILRGSGSLIVFENLTQAERDLVYEVRTFERFRRQLAVDLADRLLRLHQSLDTIENERLNNELVVATREYNESYAAAGRMTDTDVDRARQNELSSQDRMISAQQNYEDQLDSFKLFLGLPIDVRVAVDRNELDRLAAVQLPTGDIGEEIAILAARENRPDYLTVVDRVVDAERKSRVAADALRMGLNVSSSINADSRSNNPVRYNFQEVSWSLGLVLDLPVDRLPERNAYRSSLINWQASARAASEFDDTLIRDLRGLLREVTARSESQAIQANAVLLAEKRVESAGLSLQAGTGNTFDLLEAQEALVTSRNAQTRAQIDYTLAQLQLAFDMGLLRVEDNGIRIEDVPQVGAEEVSE
jgi:outer membrane protein TolC